MIRTIAFIARRADLTRARFRAHYEERHAPLARPHMGGLVHYVRNHVGDTTELGFDVISEFGYESRSAFEQIVARIASPAGDAVREDELRFMDKPVNTYFAAEVAAREGGARPLPGSRAKQLALARARDGETRAELGAALGAAARALVASGAACRAQVDVACEGDPLGAPPVDALLHAWSGDAGGGALATALGEALRARAIDCSAFAVDECGREIAP